MAYVGRSETPPTGDGRERAKACFVGLWRSRGVTRRRAGGSKQVSTSEPKGRPFVVARRGSPHASSEPPEMFEPSFYIPAEETLAPPALAALQRRKLAAMLHELL